MATGNGNGSKSQVDLLLQVVEKVDRQGTVLEHVVEKVDRLETVLGRVVIKVESFEQRLALFTDHFSEQMREVKETLGVISKVLARSVEVNRDRLDDHEQRLSKLEKSAG